MSTGTMVAWRGVFDRVGMFDVSYRAGEDSEWLFRARDAGERVAVIAEMLLYRRIHGENLSRGMGGDGMSLARMIKASFDRRRGGMVEGRRAS
jgi:hypothetical protein